jgi:hypothetical protein
VLRWINLGLGLVLATLLLMELIQSGPSAPSAPTVSTVPPVVVQEKPARRSRRMEARMAIEEARRRQHERASLPAGPPLLGPDGRPFND